MNFDDILKEHLKKYPDMQPSDAVKLAYQSCFGPEHMITDPTAAVSRIKAEYAQAEHTDMPRVECLGRFSRLYLDSEFSDAELSLIGKMFVSSARLPKGDMRELYGMLGRIEYFAELGQMSFSGSDFRKFRAEYEAFGCPAIRHSEGYREKYQPSYRLIDSRYVRLLPLIFELTRRDKTILAIDGRAASGKTTAAYLLAELFDGQVIHLDDFFLPFDMRTVERLSEPGGNMHRERFMSEVVEKLGSELSYRVFDCSTGEYKNEPRRIPASRLTVCEGAYSLHPELGKYYDLAVFSTIGKDEQKQRIIARNGMQLWRKFHDHWIPMEECYFEVTRLRERCDFII